MFFSRTDTQMTSTFLFVSLLCKTRSFKFKGLLWNNHPTIKQRLLRLCSQGVKQQSPNIFFFTSEKNVTNARTWFKRLRKPVTQWSSYLTQRLVILTRNWDTSRLWLSTAFRFSCKNTCRGDMYFVVSAVVLCSWKWSCFRGAGETHRRFACSFTIVLSVLTCTAWTGVAVACTLTDSLWFPDK